MVVWEVILSVDGEKSLCSTTLAVQVVSELGELGHREGEALTKIDSLGYQLAQLLDTNEPIVGLDVSLGGICLPGAGCDGFRLDRLAVFLST